MDLSRVFGAEPATTPAWGPSSHSAAHAAPLGTAGSAYSGDEQQAYVDAQKASAQMRDTVHTLQSQVATLTAASEALRASYNQVNQECNALRNQVRESAHRLEDVQRVVSRYAVVEEPVVASDGFTYERKVIEQYLNECRQSKSDAISQQTKEVLTDTLLANMSLKKLVELLKTVKPDSIGPIPAKGDNPDMQQRVAKLTDDDDGHGNQPARVPDGRLHPCVRVYGFCNYKESCTYANYPYDACLSHLKGKCRFGAQCHEFHVDLKRPTGGAPGTPNRGPAGPQRK